MLLSMLLGGVLTALGVYGFTHAEDMYRFMLELTGHRTRADTDRALTTAVGVQIVCGLVATVGIAMIVVAGFAAV